MSSILAFAGGFLGLWLMALVAFCAAFVVFSIIVKLLER